MRIIAGQFRGVALASVGKGDAGAHLRPTTDRVRESLFNVLNNHDVIEGARVLDLFAGTGAHLRPTTDRVRESLFNVLNNHDVIEGSRVLDLFAGTGALGLEALSRGAAHVAFVDDGRVAQRLIGQNIAKLRLRDRAEIIRRDARKLPGRTGAPFDLLFLDPPYRMGFGAKAVASALDGGWLARKAFIVWEEATPMDSPDGFEVVDTRRYGDTHITLMSNY